MTEKFNSKVQSINSRLSIQVSLTGLSFLIANLETKATLFFSENKYPDPLTPEELLFEIEKEISKTEKLSLEFEEILVVYSTKMHAAVPLSFFEESRASEFLKFNSKILSTDFVAHDIIDSQDIVVVYVPFVNINNYFFEKYGSFQYYHGVTSLLKGVLKIEGHSIVPKMYLHLQGKMVDCVIIKDGSLQLCNTFSYRTPEDLIYYILFCMEQLKLNPDTIPLFLCGNIEKGDANYEILYTYIRTIKFVENQTSLTLEASHKDFLINNTLL